MALVSSFEFLRNPIYRIVDGISISSDGPVYSVVVAHGGALSDVEEIELDPASETSVNLLRCLLASKNFAPRLTTVSTAWISSHRARLFIGDQAIRFRQEHETEFEFWDLGAAWKELVNLPFVYALWLVRPEFPEPDTVAQKLRELRDRNLPRIKQLISKETKFDLDFCERYFAENIRFSFGEREKKGLLTFANLCVKHGLLPDRNRSLELV